MPNKTPILRLKRNKKGYYYIRLEGKNGKKQFHTEAFESPQSAKVAKEALESIIANIKEAEIIIEE